MIESGVANVAPNHEVRADIDSFGVTRALISHRVLVAQYLLQSECDHARRCSCIAAPFCRRLRHIANEAGKGKKDARSENKLERGAETKNININNQSMAGEERKLTYGRIVYAEEAHHLVCYPGTMKGNC